MNLSEADYIYVGLGCLYAAPFMGRMMLFRLLNADCSLLIYYNEPFVSSAAGTDNESIVVRSSVRWPTMVSIHFDPASTLVSLPNLLKQPSAQLEISNKAPTVQRFGQIELRLEFCGIPMLQKHIRANWHAEQRSFKIASSPFSVTGRANVSDWPIYFPKHDIKTWCCKVSIKNVHSQAHYDFKSDMQWSLSAIDTGDGSSPALEMHLQGVTH